MENNGNKVEVIIGGGHFTLVSEKPKEYTLRVAKYVDDQIEETRTENSKISLPNCTTLASVNIANKYFEAQEELQGLRAESKEALANYKPALEKIEELTKSNSKLEEDIDRLKDDLVNSLNTIGNMNKGFSSIQEENEKMKDEIFEKNQQILTLEDNLIKMQEEVLQLQKQLQSLKARQIYDRKG